MSLFLHDNFDSNESFEPRGSSSTPRPAMASLKDEFHILGDKLRIPEPGRIIARPRLDEMIEKSLSQFGATLISGRSGTGKTALAADYARKVRKTAWYSVETSDTDWNVFSRYFAASVAGALSIPNAALPTVKHAGEVSKVTIAEYLSNIFSQVDEQPAEEPVLIVLDDLHRIFDASWFGEFFNLLLYSLRENTHLLLICRSRPPSPLWRLRSKQMLNVIDEKLLAFNAAETTEFFAGSGLSNKTARSAHADSFGRIAKVMQIASKSSKQPRP
ncbi:MAG: AAA family ATPase [Pyrinomonadaceae bacterium]